jgi:hypothetical protein
MSRPSAWFARYATSNGNADPYTSKNCDAGIGCRVRLPVANGTRTLVKLLVSVSNFGFKTARRVASWACSSPCCVCFGVTIGSTALAVGLSTSGTFSVLPE